MVLLPLSVKIKLCSSVQTLLGFHSLSLAFCKWKHRKACVTRVMLVSPSRSVRLAVTNVFTWLIQQSTPTSPLFFFFYTVHGRSTSIALLTVRFQFLSWIDCQPSKLVLNWVLLLLESTVCCDCQNAVGVDLRCSLSSRGASEGSEGRVTKLLWTSFSLEVKVSQIIRLQILENGDKMSSTYKSRCPKSWFHELLICYCIF